MKWYSRCLWVKSRGMGSYWVLPGWPFGFPKTGHSNAPHSRPCQGMRFCLGSKVCQTSYIAMIRVGWGLLERPQVCPRGIFWARGGSVQARKINVCPQNHPHSKHTHSQNHDTQLGGWAHNTTWSSLARLVGCASLRGLLGRPAPGPDLRCTKHA